MKYILYLALFFTSQQSFAFKELQEIISYDERPAGVVIEITSSDRLYLKKIMTELRGDIDSLRQRFKDLPVAIVSHYRESLILSENTIDKHPELKNNIVSLSKDTDIHVCGTYAGWNNISEDDFPDYINVSPGGPTQVNDYTDLGYLLVEL